MNSKEIMKQDNRIINRILIIAALIIFVASLEAFMLAKSSELLDIYMKINPGDTQNDYVNVVLINFLLNIFEPILISIYVFFTYRKYGANKLFRFIFGGIVFIRLANIVLRFNYGSIFYYLLVILYILFFVVIVTTPLKRKVKNGLL
ncbi:MAG: hypothetical protein GXY87_04200 [Tissierellia bacterium]|nr:hypothetical protein [Tissierellia bacterium]